MRRWFVALLLLASCTDASLELLPAPPEAPFDNRLQVSGSVCTQPTEELVFPLRVLFLVDGSESMEITDPPGAVSGETGRERAVRETSEALLASGGDVKISVVRFSSEAQNLTATYDADDSFVSYFTDDMQLIRSRLPLLAETDRTTNYINALSEAYAEIRDELTKADQESLALSGYQVVMITDGLPDAEGSETSGTSTENILDAVDAIQELGTLFHVEQMAVNTALLSPSDLGADNLAAELLQQMAVHGDGTYRSFANGGEINFLYLDLSSLRRVFTLRTLSVLNLNTLVVGDEVLADSDGDGLSDLAEAEARTNPLLPDTDGDGCRDSVELRQLGRGLDPRDPSDCQCFVPDWCFDTDGDGQCDNGCTDANFDNLCDCVDEDGDGLCDPSNYPDSDGDGLVDCEERWSSTNRRGADTDGDGLPDFQELRFGTAADIDDVDDDLDFDAVPNGEEVRTATDPSYRSQVGRFDQAYRYSVSRGLQREGRSCYDFEVANITLSEVLDDPLRSTGPGGQGYSGGNRVLVYLGEVPFDDLSSYARFRVACVQAWVQREGNLRDPPSGRIQLNDADFVELSAFDPSVCVGPGGGE